MTLSKEVLNRLRCVVRMIESEEGESHDLNSIDSLAEKMKDVEMDALDLAFRDMLIKLSRKVDETSLSAYKFVCGKKLTKKVSEAIKEPTKLWSAMEERGLLAVDDVRFLKWMLKEASENRTDLLKTVEEYERSYLKVESQPACAGWCGEGREEVVGHSVDICECARSADRKGGVRKFDSGADVKGVNKAEPGHERKKSVGTQESIREFDPEADTKESVQVFDPGKEGKVNHAVHTEESLQECDPNADTKERVPEVDPGADTKESLQECDPDADTKESVPEVDPGADTKESLQACDPDADTKESVPEVDPGADTKESLQECDPDADTKEGVLVTDPCAKGSLLECDPDEDTKESVHGGNRHSDTMETGPKVSQSIVLTKEYDRQVRSQEHSVIISYPPETPVNFTAFYPKSGTVISTGHAVVFGRGLTSHVRLNDETVSKKQFEMKFELSEWHSSLKMVITNVSPTKRIYVNDRELGMNETLKVSDLAMVRIENVMKGEKSISFMVESNCIGPVDSADFKVIFKMEPNWSMRAPNNNTPSPQQGRNPQVPPMAYHNPISNHQHPHQIPHPLSDVSHLLSASRAQPSLQTGATSSEHQFAGAVPSQHQFAGAMPSQHQFAGAMPSQHQVAGALQSQHQVAGAMPSQQVAGAMPFYSYQVMGAVPYEPQAAFTQGFLTSMPPEHVPVGGFLRSFSQPAPRYRANHPPSF